MIIRILNEGQFEVDESHLDALNELDTAVEQAVDGSDDATFATALAALLDAVRTSGSPVPADELVDSDMILPPADASADEVRIMLGEEGLIPDSV